MKWFSYDPEDGVELHGSAREARVAAEKAIERYWNGEWAEEVVEVCWGQVVQRAQMTNKRLDPRGKFDYLCDYELQTVEDE